MFKRQFFLIISAMTAVAWNQSQDAQAATSFKELDEKRIDEIAAMLPKAPAGFGCPCTDRKFWDNPKLRARFKHAVKAAEKILPVKMPEWSDAAYLEYSKNGIRSNGEKMLRNRSACLCPLVLAECLENKGRFTAKVNEVLNEYAGEPAWTLPAHDYSLDNFNRKAYSVDLRSSAFSFELAQALYLLGNKVTPAVRERLSKEIRQRLFAPVLDTLQTGRGNWWLGSKTRPVQNNWNVVCLAGVTGTALAMLPDRRERAVFVAAAEHYSRYYMNSFPEDGFCDEGVGYWNYGFGSFLDLRETLVRATDGKIDLIVDPRTRNAALYGVRIQISEDVSPAFSDCHIGTRPSAGTIAYCDNVLGLGLGTEMPEPEKENITTSFMEPTPARATNKGVSKAVEGPLALRSYFDKAGVLVCRPAANTACRLGVAIKAGGNGSHSHNDVGSFVVSLGKEQPVGEPGGPHAYTSTTFSNERYTLKLLNSFGHPVPVVAGTLQLTATMVHPKVISTNFTGNVDEITMDIACAYKVPELQRLVRTMLYDRTGKGSVKVIDNVAFSKPSAFELGLPTNGKCKQTGPSTLEFSIGGESVVAEIETPDGFDVTTETINEQSKPAFERIGIKLKKPVKSARITARFRPAAGS